MFRGEALQPHYEGSEGLEASGRVLNGWIAVDHSIQAQTSSGIQIFRSLTLDKDDSILSQT